MYRRSTSSPPQQAPPSPQAVVVVGWDNAGAFWILRGWGGPSWADGGYFRVGYGEAGIMAPSTTFSLSWKCEWAWRQPGYGRTRQGFVTWSGLRQADWDAQCMDTEKPALLQGGRRQVGGERLGA